MKIQLYDFESKLVHEETLLDRTKIDKPDLIQWHDRFFTWTDEIAEPEIEIYQEMAVTIL